jgi:acetoin utilization protein AcuB
MIRERKRHCFVRDGMTEHPQVVSPQTSLADAYRLMFDCAVRRLPVVHGHDLVGILTRSDLQRTLPLVLDALDIPTRLETISPVVGDVMTPEPITVAPDDTIQAAAECMLENQVSGLPVVEDGHVGGILTESDIFKRVVNEWTAAAC